MMPVYRFMDSGPHHRNQVPFPQYYFPGVEAVPPHIEVDPLSQSPVRYEAWPNGSYYSSLVPSHGCCYHGNFPAYYGFRPPCAHYAPAPTLNRYGDYPPFPDAFPTYYVPPPHYSMEQPRYEYDEDALRNSHCCGCHNHPWHQKNETSVKVEEQEPDIRKNEVKDVVPAQLRNYPYPIVWIPPESMKNQEDKKPFKSEVSDWDKAHGDTDSAQAVKSPEREPRVWSWFPLDMNGESSMEGDDRRKIQNQQNEGETRQFPFPIIWMPYENQKDAKNQDNEKLISASKYSERAPTNVKFGPVKPPVKDRHMKEPEADERTHAKGGSGISGQAADKKCILVKQPEVQRMDNSKETERRGKDVTMKEVEGDAKDKPSGTSEKRQSSPPPKSKVPLVFLRVDPLPKKKNGNGSSRSPSTPKGQTTEKVKATIKPFGGQGLEEDSTRNKQTQNGSMSKVKGVEPKKKEIKNIPVIEKRSEDNIAGEHTCEHQVEILSSKHVDSQEEVCSTEKTENASAECKIEEASRFEVATEGNKANDPAKSAHGECKAEKRQLSVVEATMLLQSAYRGFEVRKSEPLKKLKQITKVQEQMAEVRLQIQALESSSDLHKDDMHRLVIGEKIMSLLLKVDTIQGLHPSLRDIRKALVKELVTLQEKLDSLVSKQTKELVGESAASKLACVMDDDGHREVSLQEMQNKGILGVDENSFERARDGGKNVREPVLEQVSCVIDVAPDSKGEESAELVVVDQELEEEQEKRTNESQLIRDMGCQEVESLPSMELEGETHNCAPAVADILNNDVLPMLEHSVYLPSVPQKNFSSDEFMGLKELVHDRDEDGKTQLDGEKNGVPVTENLEGDKLMSLPPLKAAEGYATSGLEKRIGDKERETEHNAVEVNIPISSPLPVVTEISMPPEKDRDIDVLKELPVGVVEEESEGLETAKEEATKSEEGENNMATKSVSEIDGGDDMLKEFRVGVVEEELEGHETEKEEASKSEEGENNMTTKSVFEIDGGVDMLEELPVGVGEKEREGHEMVEEEASKSEEGENNITESVSEIDGGVDMLKELPVEVVEEEHEGHETVKEEASKSDEGENNMTTESASEIDEVPTASQSDEELGEADSGEWIKVSGKDMSDEFLVIHKPGEVSSGDESTNRIHMAEHSIHDENAPLPKEVAEEVPMGTHVSSEPSEESEQSVESLHPSPTATHISHDKHDTQLETDTKLIEENKRLREMMEKLMEAGREQLTLISNLTGRIKDLERKLSVKKKTRKAGYRKPKCTTPRAKPSSSLRC